MSRSELSAALARAGLLPSGDTPFSEPERWLLDAAQQLEAGEVPGRERSASDVSAFDQQTIVHLASLGWRLAALEIDAVVSDVAAGVPPVQAMAEQQQRRQAIARFVAAVRQAATGQTLERLSRVGDVVADYSRELLHVPSGLFTTRHGLAASVDRLRREGDHVTLGRLLIGLGRYVEAARYLEQDSSPAALAHLAVARALLGDYDAATEQAERALTAGETMLTLSFSAVVHAFALATSPGKDAATRVTRVSDLLARSRQAPAGPPLEHAEALLARGRVSLLLPPPFGHASLGIHDLRSVLEVCNHELEGASLGDGPLPAGVAEIFRLHANYFLGVGLAESDPPAAIAHYERVLHIDPACAFAERAYRRLSELAQ